MKAIVIDDSRNGGRPAHLGPLRQYAWRCGYVHKFSSLWVATLRFSILNRPDFPSLNADISLNDSDRQSKILNIDSHRGIQVGYINRGFFTEILGEARDAFRWSSLGDFPFGLQKHAFSHRPSICLTCMTQGFHTALFSLKWIDKCPIHDEKLISDCPICGKQLSAAIRERKKFAASLCACDNPWMSFESARRPIYNQQRDQCLESIISWMEHASERCWTYLPHTGRYDNAISTYRHLSRGLAEYGESMPSWSNVAPAEEHQSTALRHQKLPIDATFASIFAYIFDRRKILPKVYDRVKVVSESGLFFESLARLNLKFNYKEVDFEDVGKFKISSLATFKSMRRYATKHLLGNRIYLLNWVAKNQSSQLFQEQITKDKYVVIAWAILYWMRASIWRATVVDRWLEGLIASRPRDYPYDSHSQKRNRGAQRLILAGARYHAELWIEHHVNAAALLDLWPTQKDLQRCSTAEGFIEATHGTPERPPLEWWAWRGSDHRLRLAVMQRQSEFWHCLAKRASPKAIRVAENETQETLRQLSLHAQMIAPAIQYGSDGSWSYDGGLQRYAHGLVKRTRLVMGNGRYHLVGIAQLPREDGQTRGRWMLRCFDLPLVVISFTTRWGIARLKKAARLYVKSNPPH